MTANQIDRDELVKAGALAGTQAGCFASLVFVVLLVAYVMLGPLQQPGIDRLGRFFELILVPLYAFMIGGLIGVIPATVIGTFSGAVIGWCFYLAQRWLPSAKGAAAFGAVLGVALALPLLFGWCIWIFSAEIFTGAGIQFVLLFMLICGGAGAYGGVTLWRTLCPGNA